MKVAVIQSNATGDKHKNIARALELVRCAACRKARFILLPEVFNYRGPADNNAGYAPVAETLAGPSLLPLLGLARASRVFILAGSIYEKAPGSKKVFNTSVLIGPGGKIIAVYRKIHLFKASLGKKTISEPKYFLAGKRPQAARVDGFSVGMSVCYDLRFPELYRLYAKAGAEVLCVPSSFTKTTGQAHWEILLRARAVENLCYILAPGQTGEGAHGVAAYGNSMIIDPWGKVLARASGNKEEVMYADINKETLAAARKKLPGITPVFR